LSFPASIRSQTAWKSSGDPIDEPRIESCFHQTRCRAAGGFGPVVAPQTTIRASERAASRVRFQVACADIVDHDMRAAACDLLDTGDDVLGLVVDRCVWAESRAPGRASRRWTR